MHRLACLYMLLACCARASAQVSDWWLAAWLVAVTQVQRGECLEWFQLL